jgi:hypothetical protein
MTSTPKIQTIALLSGMLSALLENSDFSRDFRFIWNQAGIAKNFYQHDWV